MASGAWYEPDLTRRCLKSVKGVHRRIFIRYEMKDSVDQRAGIVSSMYRASFDDGTSDDICRMFIRLSLETSRLSHQTPKLSHRPYLKMCII